jgi:predicted nucleotidyltransferase
MKHGKIRNMISNNSRFDKEIQNIVSQLIRIYKPEKIILFGSLVREGGEPRDIDLFIIKKDVPDLGVDRIRELDALIKYQLATDFIVYKPEEVKERMRLGDPFIKNILEEGKVLYDAQ